MTPERKAELREYFELGDRVVGELLDALDAAEAEVAAVRADVAAAAGELLVQIPAPDTDAARMLIANRLLVRRNEKAEARIAKLEGALRSLVMDMLRWGNRQNPGIPEDYLVNWNAARDALDGEEGPEHD